MGITVNYILNKIIKYIILYYMRYDINYKYRKISIIEVGVFSFTPLKLSVEQLKDLKIK
jgi:hypothetical protein